MKKYPLLYGIIGFILGGLLVSVAATTFDKPPAEDTEMSMSEMTESLSSKTGDDFDKAFVADMIEHHRAAIAMAQLADSRAKHQEIKDLSANIIEAQAKEVSQMSLWQTKWNYVDHSRMGMGH
ncbi:MAG: uncharacterized protein JWM37_76 [Candidatus Saccharibacteria bacterium]|nr:uncharacterized protein [Candidatus Saccharibacteria bacterium]